MAIDTMFAAMAPNAHNFHFPGGQSYGAHRCYVITGIAETSYGPPHVTPGNPTAGGDVDGVAGPVLPQGVKLGRPAQIGQLANFECAASVSAGTLLRTDTDGRVRTATGGDKVIARALQAGSVDAIIWGVFVSGR